MKLEVYSRKTTIISTPTWLLCPQFMDIPAYGTNNIGIRSTYSVDWDSVKEWTVVHCCHKPNT